MRMSLAFLVILCVPVLTWAQDGPRVFVTDSESWQVAGGFVADDSSAAGVLRGGARPQTVEIIKTVREECAGPIVTIREDRANYILMLDHEGGKGLARRDNKWALFSGEGDALGSGSTRALGNAVKDACRAMLEDWRSR